MRAAWAPGPDCLAPLRRENIEKDIEVERRRAENPDVMEEDVDQVPCITRAHFEEVRPPSPPSFSSPPKKP